MIEPRGADEPGPAGAAAEQARALFAASPLPLWIYDLETLRFLDVNEVACAKYGWCRADFLAMSLRDIRPSEDVAAVERSVRRTPPHVFNSGVWRHRLRDGTEILVEITSHELVHEGRRARLVCPIDVTQRVHAEAALREREQELEHAQSLTQLAHAVSGPDGRFERWSQSLPGLLALAPGQAPPASTREWLELVDPADRDRFRAASIDAARTGRRVDMDYRLHRPDGQVRDMRQVIDPLPDVEGYPRGRWFSTVQDVTAQKEAERRVVQANEALEARVRERTAQLEASNLELARATAAAESANRAKSEFLSAMSHELRTPLNAIMGFGQLLAMPDMMDGDAATRTTYVEHILDAGRHLLALINDVLNLAQIEAGQLAVRLEDIALGPVFDECRAMVAPLAAPRAVTLGFPAHCALAVRADRGRLKQVLLNLLSNAIKYNRDGGRVDIDCSHTATHVRLHVRDTGIGLGPDRLSQLFQPFNRLGQEALGTEGTGIGLVVTQRLLALMDGTIGVESTPGKGSVFWIELPVAHAAPPSTGGR